MLKWSLGSLGALLLIAALVLVGGYLYLRSSLPQSSGQVAGIAGLSAETEILRDEQGIPSIFAANRMDAYRALGFAHAQDRLWQMEMQRHIAQGRISELVGDSQIGTDKFLRALGVWQAAQSAWATMADQRTRDELQAYADGVNAYLDQRSGALPPEFLILGLPAPAPWEPVHSVAWMKMMAWDLGSNWGLELDRFRMALQDQPKPLSNAHIQDLEGRFIGEAPLVLPDLRQLYLDAGLKPLDFSETDDELALLTPFGRKAEGLGSNNWVVGGQRSASGKPLLANDPHLSMKLPGVWYFARLKGGDLNGVGATLPGVPFIVIGRNDRFGWGFTNGYPDVQDLTIEKIDGDTALRAQGSAPITSRTETIKIAGGEPVELTIRASTNGTFISDGMNSLKRQLGPDYAMAFNWTALAAEDSSVAAMSCIIDIQTQAELKPCLSKFNAPQQNMAYGFTTGEFGFVAAGKVPVRDPANPTYGHAPGLGWDQRYRWRSFVAYDDLPQEHNPARGYSATANARNHGPDYPHYMGRNFATPYRINRIHALMDETDKHDQASFWALLGDDKSTFGAQMTALMTSGLEVSGEAAQKALSLLEGWDGSAQSDQPEPAIFWVYVDQLLRAISRDELGSRFENEHKLRAPFLIAALTDHDVGRRWCSEKADGCLGLRAEAFEAAVAILTGEQGEEPAQWEWGKKHSLFAGHLVFANVSPLDKIFNIEVPGDGGGLSVNVAGFKFLGEDAYKGTHTASLRQVLDFADLEQSTWSAFGGQSGNVLSQHYSDLHPGWVAVDGMPMVLDEASLRQSGGSKLVLKP